MPPEDTSAVTGSRSSRMMATCLSTGSESDSTSVWRNSATLSLRTPAPSSGLNLIHAPASGFGRPRAASRSPPYLSRARSSSAAVRSCDPFFDGSHFSLSSSYHASVT